VMTQRGAAREHRSWTGVQQRRDLPLDLRRRPGGGLVDAGEDLAPWSGRTEPVDDRVRAHSAAQRLRPGNHLHLRLDQREQPPRLLVLHMSIVSPNYDIPSSRTSPQAPKRGYRAAWLWQPHGYNRVVATTMRVRGLRG